MGDSLAIMLLEKIELFLYRKAKIIVSVTHSFKTLLAERGIDPGKIHVVTNGVDASRFFPSHKDQALIDRHGLQNRFVAGYVGTHGLAHHLETMLEAAAMAKANGDPFSFLMLGNGARKAALVEFAANRQLDNVIFVDSVPKDEVARYWSLLDVSVIHLKKTPLFTSVIPSKLFECMAMGIPVLHGVAGESADIVSNHAAGLTFEPENAVALYQGLQTLYQDGVLYQQLRSNGLAAAQQYDRKHLAQRFLMLLQEIARK